MPSAVTSKSRAIGVCIARCYIRRRFGSLYRCCTPFAALFLLLTSADHSGQHTPAFVIRPDENASRGRRR